MEANPVCPSCGTVYNRQAVVRELKKLSPELFMFGGWTTRFVCQVCRTEIWISGSGAE